MAIEIRDVTTEADLKQFIDLPYRLYKNNNYWVPPIKKGELRDLSPNTNPSFKICDAKFWIALKDNQCVGRIGGIINHKYNEKVNKNYARFTRMEFEDDKEVSQALFSKVEEWAREKNAEAIQGPLGFTNLDLQGLLVEGFDRLPAIASVYHLPYYKDHIESLGYEKEIDWVEFRLYLADEVPRNIKRVASICQKKYKLKTISFSNKKELFPYRHKIFEVFNESFQELYFTVPFDKDLITYYADHFFSIINPRLIKMVIDEQEKPQGFIIGLPSLSRALQKARGSLFPFGIFHIMKGIKKPDCVELALTAVTPEFQAKGVAALLTVELQNSIMAAGAFEVETTGIFEDNTVAINIWKNWKYEQHKRRRAYTKKL
jgi:ribosomal protein S18 acetylase RimI-like enzyme